MSGLWLAYLTEGEMIVLWVICLVLTALSVWARWWMRFRQAQLEVAAELREGRAVKNPPYSVQVQYFIFQFRFQGFLHYMKMDSIVLSILLVITAMT